MESGIVFLPYTTAKPATPVPGVNMTEKEPQSFMQQKAVYLLCQLGLLVRSILSSLLLAFLFRS